MGIAIACTLALAGPFQAPDAAEASDRTTFRPPVRLMAGGEPMGQEQMYPSPALYDLDGDGVEELVIGDLMGNLRVSRRVAGGDAITWSAAELLKGHEVSQGEKMTPETNLERRVRLQKELEDLVEVNEARGILALINRGEHRLHLLLPWLEPQRPQHYFERIRIDHTLAIRVKQVECLTDLAALLLTELEFSTAHRLRTRAFAWHTWSSRRLPRGHGRSAGAHHLWGSECGATACLRNILWVYKCAALKL